MRDLLRSFFVSFLSQKFITSRYDRSKDMTSKEIACVASVSVAFFAKNTDFRSFGCVRHGARTKHLRLLSPHPPLRFSALVPISARSNREERRHAETLATQATKERSCLKSFLSAKRQRTKRLFQIPLIVAVHLTLPFVRGRSS